MPKSNSRVFIIAEVAQAHDGSLGMAHSYIDLAAKCGADAVKFQTHIASAESTPSEPWRVKFSTQDKNRYEYWKRMEFSKEQWKELSDHAVEKGLLFMSSPFSIEAAELLMEIGIKMWKVASGEVSNIPLFDFINESKLPVFLSTGMSSMEEIDTAVDYLSKGSPDITIMQCTSMYPTPPEKTGLNLIPLFKERYNCKAGLSDHSGEPYACLAAAAIGADVLEAHITFSREMFGPDVPVSLDETAFTKMVEGVRIIEEMNNNPVDKDKLFEELTPMRKLFTRSIVARKNIAPGTIITEEFIVFKKPGTGVSPENAQELLGKKAIRELKADEIINLSDVE